MVPNDCWGHLQDPHDPLAGQWRYGSLQHYVTLLAQSFRELLVSVLRVNEQVVVIQHRPLCTTHNAPS